MNLPSFPTDNLYKFLAIAGAVLAVVSIGFIEYRVMSDSTQIAEAEALTDVVTLEIETFRDGWVDRFNELDAKLDRLDDSSEELDNEERNRRRDEIREEFVSVTERYFSELRPAMDRILDKQLKSKLSFARSKSGVDATESLFRPLFFVFMFGLVVSYAGFQLWYLKLQRYQDAVVRAEGLKAGQEESTEG